ncbi:hypothetical protein M8818_001669 [Zalaria obscura]|uniref:Uncharacterized protein n=1 Tax=Zalaria obscura TaxID=2024903 RepID=A0ACC3SJ20_9PEZI
MKTAAGAVGEGQSRRRQVSVFDVTAGTHVIPYIYIVDSPVNIATGRVGYESFLHAQDISSRYRDTKSNSRQAVPPEEVLFRRKGAPQRYEENDLYFINDHLPPDQRLPDEDLLRHLHTYASDFYHASTVTGGSKNWRSLDETALLALGILLEEELNDSLGTSGDLAFVEGEDQDAGVTGRTYWNGERWTKAVVARKPAVSGSNRTLTMESNVESVPTVTDAANNAK